MRTKNISDCGLLLVAARRYAAPRCPPRRFLHASAFRLPPSAFRLPPSRSGVTLIELLVVISIILLLMGLAAHNMHFAKDSRRSREAARAVSVYLGSARSTALATRRPCGVMLVSASAAGAMANCVVALEQAEVPVPYAGGDTASAAALQFTGSFTYAATLSGTFNSAMVHTNDVIQFNYEGPWYTITSVSGSNLSLTISDTTCTTPWATSWPTGMPGVPYRIYRQPNTSGAKAVAEPLQLPAGSVIDLTASGCPGLNDPFGTPTAPITPPLYIMFAPSGAVYSVIYNGVAYSPTQLIFLLVGRADEARGLGATTNYKDLNNLWVVIDPQTGLVTTAPVAAGGTLPLSRSMALDAQLMGGR